MNTKSITVNGKAYNVIQLSDEEFNESHRDASKAISTHSKTKGNNVVVIGKEQSSDIINQAERDAVLAAIN